MALPRSTSPLRNEVVQTRRLCEAAPPFGEITPAGLPRLGGQRSSGWRRLVRGICAAPKGGYRSARRAAAHPSVQGSGRGQSGNSRKGALCIARGSGNTTSQRMRAPSARDRPTSRARWARSAWWMSARSARAQARTQRRKLRDAAGLVQPELLRIEQRELEAARLS